MIKNESGITMTSLVIYVIMLSIITGIIAMISSFFYENIFSISLNAGNSHEYDKLNLYILRYAKNGYGIISGENNILEMSNGEKNIVFKYDEGCIYFNEVKLCKNIDDFLWKEEISENGKNILVIKIKIDGKEYDTNYVIE